MDEREARMGLSCVVEPGSGPLGRLVEAEGPVAVWRALLGGDRTDPWAERARRLRLDEVSATAAARQIRFVVPGDEEWPVGVEDLRNAEAVQQLGGVPLGLWLRGGGCLTALASQSVAIVGSRASSSYGDAVAEDIAAELGESGWATVSGGAYGIDAAAHRGALASTTPTIAVLAGGVDEAYPPSHRALFERIAEHGLVISELPPGAHPTRVRFIARNRVIASLSMGVVIVEAAHRSGARNTVTWAQTVGRPVMAVPGPVHSVTSATPHRLLRDREAELVTCADDVVQVLGPLGIPARPRPSQHRALDDLTHDQLAVLEALPGRGAITPGELALRSGRSVAGCLAALGVLIARGLVAEGGGQVRLARKTE
ncbi:MAG TPA: DNA-protecting protein DprA [Propionibacteriaceae bacterium]|jgi:DNA processing protein|nr:DNA-protecting protein DprA [Micropruina sp.]HBX82856.1 DNA-protecting protein DprA [Propionibacteriaceae bacterium]HBY23395.1 DNA-protecting protein DprA [Propionibacteriaceae bacterium]